MALKYEDFIDDAQKLNCEVAALQAVASVESAGGGFWAPGVPKTLFEGHIFHKYTKGVYDKDYPNISYPKWTKEFYGNSKVEQDRLAQAIMLDTNAALMSASWGMFQIMGFNFTLCGFTNVQDFVTAMSVDENTQLELFTQYIIHSNLDDELRELRWADFARFYNGPLYAKNQYDVKLAAAYEKFKKQAS